MRASLLVAFALVACGSSSEAPSTNEPAIASRASDPAPPSPSPSSPTPGPSDTTTVPPTTPPPSLPKMVVVTFNTGMHDLDSDDDFPGAKAKTIESYYGAGLAWEPAIVDAAAWLKTVDADIIGFQEIFDPEECPKIPVDKRAGLVCETWKAGDPSIAQRLVGSGYQVACHLDHHDICAAVKLSFGKFKGCTGAVCPDGLGGVKIPDCGHGGRVGRAVVDLVNGASLTVVSVHASSGFDSETVDCRKKQFEQIFVSLDGAPAANGKTNVILGDFNTDPGRLTSFDPSAKSLDGWIDGKTFDFVTDVGSKATPTYQQKTIPFVPAGLNIDLVASDGLKGSCWTPGITAGHPAVGPGWFDHTPQVCTIAP